MLSEELKEAKTKLHNDHPQVRKLLSWTEMRAFIICLQRSQQGCWLCASIQPSTYLQNFVYTVRNFAQNGRQQYEIVTRIARSAKIRRSFWNVPWQIWLVWQQQRRILEQNERKIEYKYTNIQIYKTCIFSNFLYMYMYIWKCLYFVYVYVYMQYKYTKTIHKNFCVCIYWSHCT